MYVHAATSAKNCACICTTSYFPPYLAFFAVKTMLATLAQRAIIHSKRMSDRAEAFQTANKAQVSRLPLKREKRKSKQKQRQT